MTRRGRPTPGHLVILDSDEQQCPHGTLVGRRIICCLSETQIQLGVSWRTARTPPPNTRWHGQSRFPEPVQPVQVTPASHWRPFSPRKRGREISHPQGLLQNGEGKRGSGLCSRQTYHCAISKLKSIEINLAEIESPSRAEAHLLLTAPGDTGACQLISGNTPSMRLPEPWQGAILVPRADQRL